MTNEEKIRLKFRRQYIISPENIECPFLNKKTQLTNGYYLYSHIDLILTEESLADTRLILLGDMFDYEIPENQNHDILADIIHSDFKQFLNNTAKYTGRFILIYIKENKIALVHDACATRKIYYYKSDKGVWCSSQAYLVALINQLEKTKIQSKVKFYASPTHRYLNNSNICDTTWYDEVSQLLPNHYLELNEFKISRYWINKPEKLSFNETVEICSKMLKGYIHAISKRYDIMLPLTGGKDSRTLLAATRDISDKVYYYVNQEKRLDEKSNDIYIPSTLSKKLNIKFNILKPFVEVDKDFEQIYFENNDDASPFYLPHIYNYYKNFPDKVNIPGNFAASGYDMWGKSDRFLSGKALAKLNQVANFEYSYDCYQKWLDNCRGFCKTNDINLLMLFYWEERLGNWGTQVHSDKDIAQEDFIPYNSRLLIHYFMTVKPKYIDRPYFTFFIKIMKKLWPEVLQMPFNPGFNLNVNKLFYAIGMLDVVRWFIYLRIIFSKPKKD